MLISPRNTTTEMFRIMFDYVFGLCSLAKLTHEINHHKQAEGASGTKTISKSQDLETA